MHRTPREARRFTDATSLSLDKPIPGSPLLTKKRELFPGSTLASPSSVALPHWGPKARSPPPGSGILTRFPFDRVGARRGNLGRHATPADGRARSMRIVALGVGVPARGRTRSSRSLRRRARHRTADAHPRPLGTCAARHCTLCSRVYTPSTFRTELSDLSGPTDPCPTAVHMEPFSTSVYKVLICILATTTKICTEGGSARAHAPRFRATDAPSYSPRPGISHALPRRPGIGRALQRHPFSGLVDSAGELLHTP